MTVCVKTTVVAELSDTLVEMKTPEIYWDPLGRPNPNDIGKVGVRQCQWDGQLVDNVENKRVWPKICWKFQGPSISYVYIWKTCPCISYVKYITLKLGTSL